MGQRRAICVLIFTVGRRPASAGDPDAGWIY